MKLTSNIKALTVLLNHMSAFDTIGFDQKFAPKPSTAEWDDYAPVEQAAARHAAKAFLAALSEPKP